MTLFLLHLSLFYFFFFLFFQLLFLLLELFYSKVIVISEHHKFLNSFFLLFNHFFFKFSILSFHSLSFLSAFGVFQIVFIFVLELSIGLKIKPKIIKLFKLFLCSIFVSKGWSWLNLRPIRIQLEKSVENFQKIFFVAMELFWNMVVEFQCRIVNLSLSSTT